MLSIMSQKPTTSQKQLEENGRNLIIKDILSGLGVDLNYRDSHGKAPLHQYGETNNLIMGALLLKGGADVNIKTKGYDRGKTPLHISVESNHVEFVKLLVGCKANVNAQDAKDQKTPLHSSAEKGNKDIFDILLAAGADVNLADRRGMTALHVNIEDGQEPWIHTDILLLSPNVPDRSEREGKLVDSLLDAGANVNLADKEGRTALHIAADQDYVKIVKLLLDRGADINRKDVNGCTPLHYCAQNRKSDMIVFLLEAGASENIRDNEDQTALHYAVRFMSNESVKTLVTCNDILDITDVNGQTALHYSVQKNYRNSVLTETLLKARVKVNIRDKEGKTALHYAAMFGYKQTVQTLLKYTDGLDIGDNFNQTALHYSAKSGETEIMEMLLEAGAGVDVKDQYGKTPLHYINNSYASEVIKVLIQHGANLDIVDFFGQTALDVAAQENHYHAVEVLKQNGVKSSKENQEEINTVLDCSIFQEVKSTIDTTPIDWPKTTQCANVDFSQSSDDTTSTTTAGTSFASGNTTPSTYTAPSMETTPTASITDPDASDDTTPSTYTAPSIDTEASASSTTTEASDETTPNSHTAPSIDKILTVGTTTIPVDTVATTTNPDITILATRTTTTDTSTNTAKQFENFTKSTGENESYQNHNLSQTKQQMINGNNQTLLDNRMKILDQSDTFHDHSAGLGLENAHKQDTMDIQETTGVLGATKNKEKRNKNYPKQNTMGKTPIDWGTTTPCVNVDVSPSTEDTTTTPTGYITTIDVTTPIMDTASATNVTSTACTTAADESDDTTTSTDTIPATVTTTIAYTTSTPATSTNSTKQITSYTTTSTNVIKTTQLKHPRKSTHNMYKSHQKYNITHPSLETLVENGQTCLGKNMEALDDSVSGQNILAQLGRTNDKQDMMVKQEKTRLGSIVKNKTFIRNNDKRKKIFDKLVRHNSSDHIENPTKSMRNSSSVRKPKKGESNLLRSGSADSLESSTKYFRKRIRTSIDDMRHQSYMSANDYRKKCFWKYKPYHRKRMKNTNLKSTGLDLNHSTKPNTLEWSDMGYHNETKRKTQMLRENEVSLPVKTVLNTVQWALSTKMTRNCGNTVNTIVNVNLNYTANIIRDCSEVNIENVKYLTIDGKFGGQDG
ncbi:ankyrin repeat domain-containing protein 50-like [Physella acuta]|uniref:ankyrin repeat domain-containing protein 50-like n=1 Tax=Physella acuta TaxID=109671 RepID=UPI0027DC7B55|nr:ankyrin repeat domain-containing protein 50-like [Physella acuta]